MTMIYSNDDDDDDAIDDEGRVYWPCRACLYGGIQWQSKPLCRHFQRSQCHTHHQGWENRFDDDDDDDDDGDGQNHDRNDNSVIINGNGDDVIKNEYNG